MLTQRKVVSERPIYSLRLSMLDRHIFTRTPKPDEVFACS